MSSNEMQQLAHLMRRAGFGATQQELEGYAAIGYEASVEKLLDTANPTAISEYLIRRYHPDESSLLGGLSGADAWLYRMVTTDTPLLEKNGSFLAWYIRHWLP